MSPFVIRRVLVVVAVVLVAVLLGRVATGVFRRLEARDAGRPGAPRRATVFRLLNSGTHYVIDFLALVIALAQVGINTTSLLAGAGVVGLAISFGAQNLVQDLVTGAFLLYEDAFQVGEQIGLPALTLTGTVDELGLRTTRLRAADGELVTIPNRFVTEIVNYSREANPVVAVEVQLLVDSDARPEAVRQILAEVASAWEATPVQVVGMTALTAGVATWSLATRSTVQDRQALEVEVRERAVAALVDAGIRLAPGVGQMQRGT